MTSNFFKGLAALVGGGASAYWGYAYTLANGPDGVLLSGSLMVLGAAIALWGPVYFWGAPIVRRAARHA